MKAMVFAAGRGTRLSPFTDHHPKCLAEAGGKTLLQHCLENLRNHGIDAVMINFHHHGQQIVDYLREQDHFGMQIAFSEEIELLETGGGLLQAREYFMHEDAFLVCNSDIYTDYDLSQLVRVHQDRSALATLSVANRETSRYLLFNDRMDLRGWEDRRNAKIIRWDDQPVQAMAFQGIQVLSPGIFDHMLDRGSHFSTIPVYLDAAKSGARILGHPMAQAFWMDIGTQEKLDALRTYLEK